jgi:hypothetical protein
MTLRRDIGNLFNILAEPGEVFSELRERPAWAVAVASLISFWLLLGWLRLPAIEAAVRNIFTSSYNEQSAEAAMMTTIRFLRVQLFVLDPLAVLARWFLIAAIICIVSVPLKKENAFTLTDACSLSAYAEASFVWMAIANLALVYYRGFGQLQSAADLNPLRGADLFFPEGAVSPLVRGMLSELNLFSVWYIALLAIGISAIGGMPKRYGGAIAGAVWLCWIALRSISPFLEKAVTGLLIS